MVAVKASDVDAYLARLDRAAPVVLIFGPDAGLVSERVNAGRGRPTVEAEAAIRLDLLKLMGKKGQRQLLETGRFGTLNEIRDLRVDGHVNQSA